MSYIVKAALFCDKCGKRVNVEPDTRPPILDPTATRDTSLEGWINVGREHHRCSECAPVYLTRKAEMEKELKQLAGVKEITFDL